MNGELTPCGSYADRAERIFTPSKSGSRSVAKRLQLSSTQPHSALVTMTTMPRHLATRNVRAAFRTAPRKAIVCASSGGFPSMVSPCCTSHVEGNKVSSQSTMINVPEAAALWARRWRWLLLRLRLRTPGLLWRPWPAWPPKLSARPPSASRSSLQLPLKVLELTVPLSPLPPQSSSDEVDRTSAFACRSPATSLPNVWQQPAPMPPRAMLMPCQQLRVKGPGMVPGGASTLRRMA
mmetsp:Transcript_91220/g.279271  ORF Transcript_91220/g.279271 Transcript_91220/m.279271 type:complete len:236 (+) Transcript_91220:153-860(+)